MISPDRLSVQQQIYNFLRTVTIKYEPLAHEINLLVLKKGYTVNQNDPKTWKYYLNMVGQYHESDKPMYVTSLDTRQSILLSPENLNNNLRTKAVYQPGGAYYKRLCDTYPDQVELIKSILFPVTSIDQAILAPDLTLLRYGDNYLEKEEQDKLIRDIEEFLEILKERWYFNFLDDEPYFYLTFWSSLWTYLAMLLMSSRMDNIQTPYVHSWDLWNKLKAYGIDNYSDILDREKAMFLYQNIDYLNQNAGKQSNLIILANNLLKSFGIGLYGRIVVQEAESDAANYRLTPQLPAVLIPPNPNEIPRPLEIKTVATLHSEIYEKGLTPFDNAETIAAVERRLGDTTLNEFATKFLEIRPLAQIKPYATILNIFLLETLIVSITNGYYVKPVEVIDPLTKNSLYLPPKELLALYHYATLKSMGIDPVSPPQKARIYRAFTPVIGSPAKTIPYKGKKLYLSTIVNSQSYLSGLTYDPYIDSPKDFSNNVTALFLRYMDHILLDQKTAIDKWHYAYAYLNSLCHKRQEIDLNLLDTYTTYDEWLGVNGIDAFSGIFDQYALQAVPRQAWGNLADAIISTLLPINDTLRFFGNFTLSNSGYERLRQLFVQMCSYRVVFLEADRDIAEFSADPKFSTEYGPDTTLTYDDSVGDFYQHAQNRVEAEHLHEAHPGFMENDRTNTHYLQNYTVITNAVTTQRLSQTKRDAARPVSLLKMGQQTMSRGSFEYNPVTPDLEN